jgi:hypothetical protein
MFVCSFHYGMTRPQMAHGGDSLRMWKVSFYTQWWNFGFHKMREISRSDEKLLASEERPFAVEWRQRCHVIVLRRSQNSCGYYTSAPAESRILFSLCVITLRARDAESVSTASWYGFVARPLQNMLADEKSLLVGTNNKCYKFRHVTWPLVSLSPLFNTVNFIMSVCCSCYRKYSKLAPDILEVSVSSLNEGSSQCWDMFGFVDRYRTENLPLRRTSS